MILSPFVLAELDYLIGSRVSPAAASAFLRQVADGVYRLEALDGDDIARALGVIGRYADLDLGLTDAVAGRPSRAPGWCRYHFR